MDFRWYANRLVAMRPAEIAWRVQQKVLEEAEIHRFRNKVRVDQRAFDRSLSELRADWSRLPLNLDNRNYSLAREITLLGSYHYAEYRMHWHAGFQTEQDWPLEPSYTLRYKQRDDIGDARTNWELNRGLQFSLLAKDFYATGDVKFLEELEELVSSWCAANPFLWGISWTSVMEVAIRCINWMYAAAFLAASDLERAQALSERLEVGAINMAAHVATHYSRHSSSNNHAIVEACALGLAGFAYGEADWLSIAQAVLGTEVVRQVHSDGVNREQCLHYQAFFMEAVGLWLLACRHNGVTTPPEWQPLLERMCNYVQDCHIAPGTWLEFGDDDKGLILSLCGPKPDVCEYTLQLMGSALESKMRWSSYEIVCETVRWLCSPKEFETTLAKELRNNSASTTYAEGGVTVIRSKDGRIVLGMDHGPLGFGSIAAHGHADALSIQLYVDGTCLIGDPGTYLYHCDLPIRNDLRATRNHSTVCIGNADQSEMLGAFMWGKRADCMLLSMSSSAEGAYHLSACHNGYEPAVHTRSVSFDGSCELEIRDQVEGADVTAEVTLIIPPGIETSTEGGSLLLSSGGHAMALVQASTGIWESTPVRYSIRYGQLADNGRAYTVPVASLQVLRFTLLPSLDTVASPAGRTGGTHEC